MSWLKHPIFFIDFEGNRNSGVIEYGVVKLADGVVVETKTRLCRSQEIIRPEDQQIHGIKNEMCDLEANFSDDWEYFASLREQAPLAAHYAGAENSLLKATWPYPRQSPDFVRSNATVREWGPWIDTARLYSQFYPNFKSGGLEDIIEAAGLRNELQLCAEKHCPLSRRSYHCALYDALAGALLLNALALIPDVAQLSLAQLITLSTLDPVKREELEQTELGL